MLTSDWKEKGYKKHNCIDPCSDLFYFYLFYFIILPLTMNYKQNKNNNKRTGWLINITPKSPYFLDELGSKTVYNWVILGISQQGFCPILQHCDVTVKNSLFLFPSFRFSTSSKGLSNGIPSQELSSFLFTQYWRRQWQQLKSAVSLHWHSP